MDCKPKEFEGKGGAVEVNRWIEEIEAVLDISECAEHNKVRFASHVFIGKARSWWNGQIDARGREAAMGVTWEEFRAMVIEEFCPRVVMKKVEAELWDLTMKGANHQEYTDRFHELARLAPRLVTPESRRIEMYIQGLHPQVRSIISATDPPTMQRAIQKAAAVTEELMQGGILNVENEKKRENKDGKSGGSSKKARSDKQEESTKGYQGNQPKCQKCQFHHPADRVCKICFKCNKPGHLANNCSITSATPVSTVKPYSCYECGSSDHFIKDCPKKNQIASGSNSNPPRIESSGKKPTNVAKPRVYHL